MNRKIAARGGKGRKEHKFPKQTILYFKKNPNIETAYSKLLWSLILNYISKFCQTNAFEVLLPLNYSKIMK